MIYTNHKRLKLKITDYTCSEHNKKMFYMFNIELTNKSRLPISLTDIIFEDQNIEYHPIRFPMLLAEKNRTRNKEIIRHQEIHSNQLPINIDGLTSKQIFLTMYGPQDSKTLKNKVTLHTSRGKIHIKLDLLHTHKNPADFMEEVSEYSD